MFALDLSTLFITLSVMVGCCWICKLCCSKKKRGLEKGTTLFGKTFNKVLTDKEVIKELITKVGELENKINSQGVENTKVEELENKMEDTIISYDKPGTYFATVMVCSERHGDVNAEQTFIPNLGKVRIVVK